MRARLVPGHVAYRPFVIITQARTGSNLLVSLLDSHPGIDARGELLRRLEGATVEARVAGIYGRKPRRVRAVGFKCFYYHPLDARDAPVWPVLDAVAGLHVVHLVRRNALRTITSRRLADLTGTWIERGAPSNGPGAGTKPRVTFTVDELRAAFEQSEAWAQACRARFAGHPLLEIAYEDLVDDPGVLDQVVAFLGLRPQRLRTSLQRQNPEPLRALIEDYDGLRRAFEGTRWAAHFDEEPDNPRR